MKKTITLLTLCACFTLTAKAQYNYDVYNPSYNTLYYVSDWLYWNEDEIFNMARASVTDDGTLADEPSPYPIKRIPAGTYRLFIVWEDTNGGDVSGRDLGLVAEVAWGENDSVSSIEFYEDYETHLGGVYGFDNLSGTCRCLEDSTCGCSDDSGVFCTCTGGIYIQWNDYNLEEVGNLIDMSDCFKFVLYKKPYDD